MARRPATLSDAPNDLAVALPAVELPPEAAAAPPDWIRIAPAGAVECRDGRSFTLDPARLVSRFDAEKVDLPVDLGHATIGDSKAPALAWLDRLEARADGLYGHVREWLAGGRGILAARTHRYVSPAWHHDESGRVTWLHSVALVAAPALAMPALLSAGVDQGGDLLAELASALGMVPGSSRQACLAVVTDWAATAVPLSIHNRVLETLASVRGDLALLKAEVRKRDIDTTLEEALKARKIVPAERADYLALCATEAGFAGVKRLLANMPDRLAPSGLDTRRVPETDRRGPDRTSPEALAAAVTALNHERAQKGLRTLSTAEAMSRIVHEQV